MGQHTNPCPAQGCMQHPYQVRCPRRRCKSMLAWGLKASDVLTLHIPEAGNSLLTCLEEKECMRCSSQGACASTCKGQRDHVHGARPKVAGISWLLHLHRMYANSWLESVRAAGISNYIIGAMDPPTSLTLPTMMPKTQCFNAPVAGVPTA
eukprot:scaffold61143_cov12-Tisochrysis_lutea.AAC.1